MRERLADKWIGRVRKSYSVILTVLAFKSRSSITNPLVENIEMS